MQSFDARCADRACQGPSIAEPVVTPGAEPGAFRVSTGRSFQLSYMTVMLMELNHLPGP
jgi:hypothetical protein